MAVLRHLIVAVGLSFTVLPQYSVMSAQRATQTRVFLWTAPRCLSTAFERAIMNLKKGKIFHEPYSTVYYFGPNRVSTRYSNTAIDPLATYEEVSKDLLTEHQGNDFVFSKDMAYYMNGNFDILRQEGLDDYKHTFLIRHPKKTIKSLYRASTNPKKTGWDYFDPNEVGFRQMLDLQDFLVDELKSKPVIIDADDLLDSPEEMMQIYCEAAGLPYQENMTSWEPKAVPEWDIWDGWHDAVLKSSGLIQKRRSQSLEKRSSFDYEREDVVHVFNESLACYEALYEKRLRPRN